MNLQKHINGKSQQIILAYSSMATATPYVSGLKKPLNQLENPVYPDIKKGPPRFVWSRKFWQVDDGATMRDTEPYTQFIEPAILAQSRNYNKTVYGQSSHRDIVNAEFRPPLISYYEDIGPLTRVPATIYAIVPRINPGTADHGAGTSGYAAKNERSSDVVGALTDRIKTKEWRPTFYAPMDNPIDNSILPDLEAKLPQVSAHAGWNFNAFIPPISEVDYDLGDDRLGRVPFRAGYDGVKISGPSGMENYTAEYNRPQYSAAAGVNTPMQYSTPLAVETFELGHNRPQVSAYAGINNPMLIDAETQTRELKYNRPQVSASAGVNTPMNLNAETYVGDLDTKLGQAPLTVINPESQYRTEASLHTDVDHYVQQNRPSYSYVVPGQEPTYRERNVETYQPHFRERLQTEKSYGQISHSSGAIPRFGLEQRRDTLGGRRNNPYMSQRKKAEYRF
jgi:hypothetical protein